MEFKKGDRIKYLGTKEGETDSDWETYFGIHGIKEGSKGTIQSVHSSYYYVENDGRPTTDGCLHDCDLELVNSKELKKPTHLVVWEEDQDPCKFFENLNEANVFIKALSENTDVKQDSIVLVEIKTARKITIQKSLRAKEFKI